MLLRHAEIAGRLEADLRVSHGMVTEVAPAPAVSPGLPADLVVSGRAAHGRTSSSLAGRNASSARASAKHVT